jgi:hypothetical protein
LRPQKAAAADAGTPHSSHKELAQKLEAMERKYDRQLKTVFEAIRELMNPQLPPSQRQIGFRAERDRQ